MESSVKSKKSWVLTGLVWGLFMFLALSVIIPMLEGGQLDLAILIKRLVVWVILGLVFGFITSLIEGKKA